jgi:G:T/U-mismatch repair DNA glycosylase
VIEHIFSLTLRYDNSIEAVQERKEFLSTHKLGICDIIASCKRQKIDASDLGMEDVELRDLLGQVHQHSSITTLVFVGGNSRNGPEYFFRKQLKEAGNSLQCLHAVTPRRHSFMVEQRRIETISLISPSPAANRAIGSNPYFKAQKLRDPSYSPFEFRVEQYRQIFMAEP